MLLLLHTAGGIAGLVIGALSTWYVIRHGAAVLSGSYRAILITSWSIGVAFGAISLIFQESIGYEIATPDGPGTVVGIPFLVAFFDAEGSDYVGWITLPGAVGNAVVWLLAPQILLAMYLRIKGRAVTPNT